MIKAVNIFLTFFLCTVVLTSSAQNLVYTPAQDVSGQISGDIVEYNINVNTPSTEAITYKWKTIENSKTNQQTHKLICFLYFLLVVCRDSVYLLGAWRGKPRVYLGR